MNTRSVFNLVVACATLVGAVPLMAEEGGGGDTSGCSSECDTGYTGCCKYVAGVCCTYSIHVCCKANLSSCETYSC